MDRPVEKEELYKLHHVPGSSGFWNNVRAVLVEPAARQPTPLPQAFPPINVSDNSHTNLVSKPHTPGYHGDSPTPPNGLPPLPNDQTKHLGWTTRPPNHNPTNQLFLKKKDIANQQERVINKYKQTNPIPIHRGMVEAVEEPSAWKIEKKKRVDNAINRVNKSYVIDPRTYKEPDINERVDNEFMPTPPTCPKPAKSRKHNLVIMDPEKMLRERNLMRGDFAPGRPPGHVPESCHSRLAAQIAAPIKGQGVNTTHQTVEHRNGTDPPSSMHSNSAAPSKHSGLPSYNQCYDYGQSAADSYDASQQQGDAFKPARARSTVSTRSHQPKVPYNAFEIYATDNLSTDMHSESAAASIHSGVYPYNHSYVYGQSAADTYHTDQQYDELCIAGQTSGYIHENSLATSQDAFERSSVSRQTTSTHIDVSASPVRSGVTMYDQRCDADQFMAFPQNNDHPPPHLRTTIPDQAKEWRQDHTNRVHIAKERVKQEYVDWPRFDYAYEPESYSPQCEIDLDAKRQQMHAKKCIEKRRKEALLKKAELQASNESGSNVQTQIHSNLMYQPTPPSKRHPSDNMARSDAPYSSDAAKQQQLIPRFTKPTHGPTIRVEPQLTWNASAAKRGLGFKSKLRREQEEAARQNKTPDNNDVTRGPNPSTPQLSDEARRRWRHKTILN